MQRGKRMGSSPIFGDSGDPRMISIGGRRILGYRGVRGNLLVPFDIDGGGRRREAGCRSIEKVMIGGVQDQQRREGGRGIDIDMKSRAVAGREFAWKLASGRHRRRGV